MSRTAKAPQNQLANHQNLRVPLKGELEELAKWCDLYAHRAPGTTYRRWLYHGIGHKHFLNIPQYLIRSPQPRKPYAAI
jgi:hypothetical protein